jgi:hypothetical protein
MRCDKEIFIICIAGYSILSSFLFLKFFGIRYGVYCLDFNDIGHLIIVYLIVILYFLKTFDYG